MADVVGTLVGLKLVSGVGTLVGIVVNALILLLVTLLMAGNRTLFPEMELCFPFCESESGNGTLFPETELCFPFCESESPPGRKQNSVSGNRTLFPI